MIKTDIIKTYILEPNYYEYEKKYIYDEYLKIFNNNNNYISYIYIEIYYNNFCKTKQIKQNYIIIFYFNYYTNNIIISKIKNYDNTKIDIIPSDDNIFNYDLRINTNFIETKIDKYIYILYYHKKYILKDKNIKDKNIEAIRHHYFYNSKYYYYKYYISYYINYYIIIYNDIKKNSIENRVNCNTIFCNFSRNFMLFI